MRMRADLASPFPLGGESTLLVAVSFVILYPVPSDDRLGILG